MKSYEHYIKAGWTTLTCPGCGGAGQVSDYGFGEDFHGTKECTDCNGRGTVWKTPKGRLIGLPGGQFI